MKRTPMTQARVQRIASMALARLRTEKKFASKPMEGPWYYVWLKPYWKIIAFAHPFGGEEGYTHEQLWENAAAQTIAKHYGLSHEKMTEVDNCPYSMPRGRVVWQGPSKEHERGRFVVYLGNDMPKSINKIKFRRDIMSKFNLLVTALDDNDRVVFSEDDHEIMQSSDQDTVENLIGRVPY